MEPVLEKQTLTDNSLLSNADYHARDAQAQCVDVAAMIFPTGHAIPADSLISAVSTILYGTISTIINAVAPAIANDPVHTQSVWQLLSRSGFLREPTLVDFALARCAEVRLNANIAKNGQTAKTAQLPALLLDDANPHLADAAQILLAAEGMRGRAGMSAAHELSPETLHQSVWRVVAAIEVISGQRDGDIIDAAKNMLARHDEGQIARIAARKAVHFLTPNAQLLNADEAGLDLYIAALAVEIGLDHDHVLRLIAAHSSAPLAMMLRARRTNRVAALEAICLVKGFDLTPRDVTDLENFYDEIDPDQTRAVILRWSIERAAFLAFTNGGGAAT